MVMEQHFKIIKLNVSLVMVTKVMFNNKVKHRPQKFVHVYKLPDLNKDLNQQLSKKKMVHMVSEYLHLKVQVYH